MKKILIVPIIAAIAIVAVLIVPSIFAKISGQHAFIEGEKVDCAVCHPGIADQLAASSAHAGTLDDGVTKWALDCKACHNVAFYTKQPGAHAATTVSCSKCHENQDVAFWHGIQIEGQNARDFFKNRCKELEPPNDCGIECHSTGKKPLIGNTPEGELATDSHKEFYTAAIEHNILLHADEACVACHTEAKKTIIIPEKTLIYDADTNTFETQ